MALTRLQKFSAAAALGLASVFSASSAQAMDTKTCGSVQEISAALDAEGQYEVITGLRIPAVDRPRNIYTTNEQQTLGYNVEVVGDGSSQRACVAVKYTDIQFNRNSDLSNPSWAQFPAASPISEYFGRHPDVKFLMHATTVARREDGSERKGAPIILFRGEAATTAFRNSGSVVLTNTTGGVATLTGLANIQTNDNYTTFARRPIQTASVDRASLQPTPGSR